MSKIIKLKLLFPLMTFLVILLHLLSGAQCKQACSQTISTQGYLRITGVATTRINLAVKEIDIEIGILEAEVNEPFNMTIWAPFRAGGSPTYIAKGNLSSPPWHEYRCTQWKWPRFVSVETVGLWGLNCFPFEKYETEIVFGISCTNINVTTQDAYLSWDLEQQGSWMIEAFPTNTSSSKISSLNNTYSGRIEEYGLKKFVSLVVRLQRPQGYQAKMFLPTWGPLIFTIVAFLGQFTFLRKRMLRRDHISMFVAIAIFTLGLSLAVREMTPPELTVSESLSFGLALFYLVALFLTIYTRSYKMSEEKNEPNKKPVAEETTPLMYQLGNFLRNRARTLGVVSVVLAGVILILVGNSQGCFESIAVWRMDPLWASVLVTVVLVAINVYYAWQNRRTIAEMEKARKAEFMPHVKARLIFLGPVYVILEMNNLGKGSAMDIKAKITFLPSKETRPWEQRMMSTGESIRILLPEGNIKKVCEKSAKINLKGTCADVFGQLFEIDEVIDTKEFIEKSTQLKPILETDLPRLVKEIKDELSEIRRAME